MAEIRDTFALQPVRSRVERFHGLRWTVRSDTVVLQDDQEVLRDIVVHTGAVGIVAINERDEILLNRQYRHPVGGYLWEPPAGLLDIADEDPLVCAQREFVEEAGLVAGSWSVLVDFFNSPGGSSKRSAASSLEISARPRVGAHRLRARRPPSSRSGCRWTRL